MATSALRIASLWPVALLIGTLTLAGCVENLPDVAVGRGDIRNAIAKGSMTSPRGATIAMASLQAEAPDVDQRFRQVFGKEAADREITVTDPKSAHYLVRGYLSAYPADNGTTIAYLYDVFDANSQTRVGRINDMLTVPASGANAWAVVDDRVMASLAGRSADDLAVMLAGTPEARTAASGVTRTAAAPAEAKPLN